MTSNYSMGYHYGVSSSSLPNLHMMSFQSGSMNSNTALTCNPVVMPFGQPTMAGTSSHVVRTTDPGPSNVLRGAVSGLKWNPGLSQEWSEKEDALLIAGLNEFASASGTYKYIKIAAKLNNKNVRDVALRCRWLMEKKKLNRCKPEDHVKKSKDRKEKVISSQANTKANVAPPYNKAAYTEKAPSEVIGDLTWQLLDENTQMLHSILSNYGNMQSFGLVQIKHNATLLVYLSRNITTLQQWMSQMPGMMSCMPPLPVSVDMEAVKFLHTCLVSSRPQSSD